MRLASGGAASSPVLRREDARLACPFLGGVSLAACSSAGPASPTHTCMQSGAIKARIDDLCI